MFQLYFLRTVLFARRKRVGGGGGGQNEKKGGALATPDFIDFIPLWEPPRQQQATVM